MEIGGVGSWVQRAKPSPMSSGTAAAALVMIVQLSGASTVSWKVAFWSGCSATAYIRRESGASNCEYR